MSIKPTNRKARANYKPKVTRQYIEFYPTEEDLLNWLNAQPNKQGYLKRLIQEDMARK